MRVKALSERDRRRLLMHFLELGESDRLLRFGEAWSDEAITRYVQKLDFTRDAVFGVFDDDTSLVGVGHLAFVPREALPALREATPKARIAEFGVSVSARARRIGIGSKLFERAAIHCRNEDIDTLYMHCLSSNKAVIHTARKAGMEMLRLASHGDEDACLKLPSASHTAALQEVAEEPFSSADSAAYTARGKPRGAIKWWRRVPRTRKE